MDTEFIRQVAINAIGGVIASSIVAVVAAIFGRRVLGAQAQHNSTHQQPQSQAAPQPTYAEAAPAYTDKPKRKGIRNRRASWAIWVGLGSFIPYFLGPLGLLSPALAIAAIVFGFQSFMQPGGRLKAWGGIVMSFVHLAVLCLVIVAFMLEASMMSSTPTYQPNCFYDWYGFLQCY